MGETLSFAPMSCGRALSRSGHNNMGDSSHPQSSRADKMFSETCKTFGDDIMDGSQGFSTETVATTGLKKETTFLVCLLMRKTTRGLPSAALTLRKTGGLVKSRVGQRDRLRYRGRHQTCAERLFLFSQNAVGLPPCSPLPRPSATMNLGIQSFLAIVF